MPDMFPIGQGILPWLCSLTRGDSFLPVFCFNFLSTFGIQFFLSCKVQSFWRKSTCLNMKLHTGFYSMSSGTFFPNKEIAATWIHRNRSEEVINRSPMRSSNIIPVAHWVTSGPRRIAPRWAVLRRGSGPTMDMHGLKPWPSENQNQK